MTAPVSHHHGPVDPSPRRIAALVLAAGSSSRFGAADKLLHPWRGRPFLAHVLDAVRASSLCPARPERPERPERPARSARPPLRHALVTGHAHQDIEAALLASGAADDFTLVRNPEPGSGMAGSLVLGLEALLDRDAVLVCLGDMPEIAPAVIDALIDGLERHPEAGMVVPVHAGQRGNPVLIARRLFDAVRALRGDVGARVLAKRFPECVLEVETPCAAVLRDYDTPADLEHLPGPDTDRAGVTTGSARAHG